MCVKPGIMTGHTPSPGHHGQLSQARGLVTGELQGGAWPLNWPLDPTRLAAAEGQDREPRGHHLVVLPSYWVPKKMWLRVKILELKAACRPLLRMLQSPRPQHGQI